MDEGHLVSHEESKRYQAVQKLMLKHPSALKYAITGTPCNDKLVDLWGLINLLSPELAGPEDYWNQRYERVVKSFKKQIQVKNKRTGKPVFNNDGSPKTFTVEIPLIKETQNLDELAEKLKSIMFRVQMEGNVEFKDETKIITVPLTVNQKKLYTSIKEEILTELDSRFITVQVAAVKMLRLLQAAEGLFNFDSTNLESGKLDYIVDFLKNSNEKVVVWSRFQEITNLLGSLFPTESVVYNGEKSKKYKTLAKWAFNGVYDNQDLVYFNGLKEKVKDFSFGPGEAKYFFGVIDLRSAAGIDLHKHCRNPINKFF